MPENHEAPAGSALVEALRVGERQVHGPLAIFPLHLGDGDAGGGPRYITLRQALAERRAAVTEVSEGGSVPELRVVNKGDARILVLDGEELRGAKQNRVLNTSILIGKHSSLVVPVSCTEQGRWAYSSADFAESDIVAERQVRYAMKDSTNASLLVGAGHCSDQGRVWSEVGALHAKHGTHSGTGAMRDAYASRKRDLDTVLAAFPLVDGQQGLLVLHGGRAIGLDLVSRAPQYAELHDKLLRSYAFEALVAAGEPGDRVVADAFLERIAGLPGQRYKSPGLGWDVRYEGGGLLGSALTYRGRAVHAAFFDVGGVSGGTGAAGGRYPRRPHPDWRIADARERAGRRKNR
jgi:hypothetical protein